MKRLIALAAAVLLLVSSLSLFASASKITSQWTSVNIQEGGDGTYTLPEGSVLLKHADDVSVLVVARAPGAVYEVEVTGSTVEVFNTVENASVTDKLDVFIDGKLIKQVDDRVPFSVVKSGLSDGKHTVKIAVNDATSTGGDNQYMFYLTGVRATSKEVLPILYNSNVSFYVMGDTETKIDLPAIADIVDGGCIGPNYEVQTNCAKNPASHHLPEFPLVEGSSDLYAQSVAVMSNCVTEIKFVGTSIRLGTCYRNGANGSSKQAKVEIDGKEYPVNNDALMPPIPEGTEPANVHNTEPTYFFEAKGLKDIEHTVRIYNLDPVVRLALDHYEITPGTGKDTPDTPVKPPKTGDALVCVTVLTVLAGGALVLAKKKR